VNPLSIATNSGSLELSFMRHHMPFNFHVDLCMLTPIRNVRFNTGTKRELTELKRVYDLGDENYINLHYVIPKAHFGAELKFSTCKTVTCIAATDQRIYPCISSRPLIIICLHVRPY
jgi:hypothetical protein